MESSFSLFVIQHTIHTVSITSHNVSYACIPTSVYSVVASIEMTQSGNKTFRVRCTSTGGRVLNMSVTGPDFNSDLNNIQVVGTLKRMGNDSYTATTGNISGGSERQLYYCTASNGVSTLMGCVGLKGGNFCAFCCSAN